MPERPDERLPPTERALGPGSPGELLAGGGQHGPAEQDSSPDSTLAGSPDQTLGCPPPHVSLDSYRISDNAVARSFGDYSLIRKIASGGMGVIYLARQESLRRTVALKTILAGDLASHDEIQRLPPGGRGGRPARPLRNRAHLRGR